MSFEDDMKQALVTFTIESLELVENMEDLLLNLEDGSETYERVNAIFRAAHTVKGSAGLFGLDHIIAFTHVVESVLDQLREGKLPVSADLIAALLPCCDHIELLVRAVAAGDLDPDPDTTESGQLLLEQLQTFLDGPDASLQQVTSYTEEPAHVETMLGSAQESGNWHISLRFGEDSLRNGMDPLSFIRYLATLGEITHLTTISSAMPDAEQMDAESSYLGFEIDVNSQAGKEALENVFEFVRDDSLINILPLQSTIADYIELIRSLPEDDAFLGELLVKSGVLTRRELEDGLSKQQNDSQSSPPAQPIGEILVEQQVVQQPLVNAALEKQKQIKDNKARENQSIRVDAERLDKLIDLIGELVISSAGVNLRAKETAEATLLETTSEMMRLVEEVRDGVLQLRMVPIGSTFSRFQRVVRDVSKELGKDIGLVISGGETEVDKSVMEKIGDPLMHLVRNAMDHGIESAEIRQQRGKPSQGSLRLNA